VVGGLETPAPAPVAAPKGHGNVEFLGHNETLIERFSAGQLDALISNHIPSLFRNGSASMVRLFPDYKMVEQDYYKRTEIFPIMHMVAMRAGLHFAEPWIADRVYKMFCRARDIAVDGLYDTDALRLTLPWLIDHVEESRRVLGQNYWRYGKDANRKVWDVLCEYQFAQKISPRKIGTDDLFARGDLIGARTHVSTQITV
jgi:4,5-dihydroxyphthalate decarboxylase